MSDFATLFHDLAVPGVSILEKIIRPIVVYAFLVIGIRLAGKRTLASLNAFDLVVILSISNTVQNAIIGEDSSVSGGLIGATTLLITNYLVVRFFFRHPRLDEIIEGKATILIKDGKIQHKNLDGELITQQELAAAAHKQGFHALDDIESAELDPGGAMVFTAKSPTIQETHDHELHRKLDYVSEQIATLIKMVPGGNK